MAPYIRKDSPFFWLRLEGFTKPNGRPWREATEIRHDTPTSTLRKEARRLADTKYHQRMQEMAAGGPSGRATITFAAFAEWYTAHKLPTHRGSAREREILVRLVAEFGELPLPEIHKHRVAEWMTRRAAAAGPRGKPPAASTINREVNVLKSVLQAAVPKYFDPSPLYGMKQLRTVTPKRRVLSVEEEDRLLAVMDVEDRAMFLVALDTLTPNGGRAGPEAGR